MPPRSLAAALTLVAAWAGTAGGQTPTRIVAAGDIACDPADSSYNGGEGTPTNCRMKATSDRALALAPAAVLLLGDNQYENGSLAKFQASFDPTWGRLKPITRPAVGNHEYLTANAAGYYSYFGAAAGNPAEGWYSFDLGGWHLIALNSNCSAIGGCGAGSAQAEWLAADLAAHPGVCTLAFWHHPRFSNGQHGVDATSQPFWEALYDAGADLVLNGHDHLYERFSAQDPNGVADPAGLRQHTVGTGGKNLTGVPLGRPVVPNSARRVTTEFGVLLLDLYPEGWFWWFVDEDGAVHDSGVRRCHSVELPPPADFHSVTPCRLADTRQAPGASGAPALSHGESRAFPVAGLCGVPADATSVAVNLTAAVPSGDGDLQAYPAGITPPNTGVVAFRAGRTRAAGTVVELGVGGHLAIGARVFAPGTTVDVVIDVTGYFR